MQFSDGSIKICCMTQLRSREGDESTSRPLQISLILHRGEKNTGPATSIKNLLLSLEKKSGKSCRHRCRPTFLWGNYGGHNCLSGGNTKGESATPRSLNAPRSEELPPGQSHFKGGDWSQCHGSYLVNLALLMGCTALQELRVRWAEDIPKYPPWQGIYSSVHPKMVFFMNILLFFCQGHTIFMDVFINLFQLIVSL